MLLSDEIDQFGDPFIASVGTDPPAEVKNECQVELREMREVSTVRLYSYDPGDTKAYVLLFAGFTSEEKVKRSPGFFTKSARRMECQAD